MLRIYEVAADFGGSSLWQSKNFRQNTEVSKIMLGKINSIRKYLTGTLLILFVAGGVAFGQAYTREEYNEYQKAVSDGPDAILEFVESHPDSTLNQYATGAYLKAMQEALNQGNNEAVLEAGEKYMEALDPDKYEVLLFSTYASYNSKEYQKSITYGEKTYNAKPDPELAMIIAESYLSLDDVQNMVPWTDKACVEGNVGTCSSMFSYIAGFYAGEKEWDKSAEYASKVIGALEDKAKPAELTQGQINQMLSDAYSFRGRSASEKKQWAAVKDHYDKSVKYAPENNSRKAEALFWTGMSLWNQEQIENAMEYFARGCANQYAETPYAELCRKELERLYKSTHNGSLAGFDEYLEDVNS